MSRRLGGLAATFVALLIVAVGPAVVGQEADTSPLSVRQVDATDPDAVHVDVIWTGDREAVTNATIREGGQEREHEPPQPLSAAGVETAMVVAVDTSTDKLELARRHGADEIVLSDDKAADTILQMTDGYGADAVFDFAGVQPTVTLATQVIAPDGALRFVGLGGGSFSYSVDPLVNTLPWGVDVRRSYAGTRQDQRAVIELAIAGRIDLATTLYALEDGPKAFEDLEQGRVSGRAILVPS